MRFWTARRGTAICLTAGTLVAGCADDAADRAEWLDYFNVVDTLAVADSSLLEMISERDAAPERPWRVTGLGPETLLWSPSHGSSAADALMGLPRDVGNTPYWGSWSHIHGAQGGSTVFAAVNFVYLVRVYRDGGLIDSIGTAPESWRQAPRLKQGAFSGQSAFSGQIREETGEEMRAYLRDATFITGLAAISDSVLVVAHGRYTEGLAGPAGDVDRAVSPGRASNGLPVTRSDYVNIYVNGRRVVADAPAPGEILGYWSGRIVFGKRASGHAGYTLTEYVWSGRSKPRSKQSGPY